MTRTQSDLLATWPLRLVVGALWLVTGLLTAVGVWSLLDSLGMATLPSASLVGSVVFGLLVVGLGYAIARFGGWRRDVEPPSRRPS